MYTPWITVYNLRLVIVQGSAMKKRYLLASCKVFVLSLEVSTNSTSTHHIKTCIDRNVLSTRPHQYSSYTCKSYDELEHTFTIPYFSCTLYSCTRLLFEKEANELTCTIPSSSSSLKIRIGKNRQFVTARKKVR